VRNLADPLTWAPAAGAVLFAATDADERVSDWARSSTPVFGSAHTADRAADVLEGACLLSALGTALTTPSGRCPGEVARNKAGGLLVEGAAGGATLGATLALKEATGRLRPDGTDHGSFPSGHTSLSASGALLTRRNLAATPMDSRLRGAAQGAVTATAALTGWARVESGAHYPSDVLAGFALGNALTGFVHDAFLGPPGRADVTFAAGPTPNGVGVSLGFSW